MRTDKKRFVIRAAALIVYGAGVFFTSTAQNGSAPPSGSEIVNPIPSPYSSLLINSVISWDVTKPGMAVTEITNPNANLQDVKQTTQYVDGLGRQVQTVAKKISPNGFDMVSPVLYDDFGRETFKYLPYVSSTSDGSFKQDPFNEQQAFSYNQYPGEQYYYGKTDFEPSPLKRPTETYAPGNSWVGSANGAVIQYGVNTDADSVVIWNIDFASGDVPVFGGYYPAGTLYRTITNDENNTSYTVEFKDVKGHVVLKKVLNSIISKVAITLQQQSDKLMQYEDLTAYYGWNCTFYIYDDLDNLRYVIQPQGVEYLRQPGNNWQFDNSTWNTSTIAKQQCFTYEYDQRKRMIIKRVPGAGEVWMVYDARDRLVMTQDANLRTSGKWLYTSYDDLNRPVATGLWTNSGDRSTQQTSAGTSTNYPNPSSGYEVLTKTFYDDYVQVNATGSGLATGFITANITNTNIFATPTNTSFPYPQPIKANYQIKNQVTGTQTEVPGTGTYLYATNYYDDHNRLIETQSTNYTGAKDTVTVQYSFSGQLLTSFTAHGKGGTNPQNCRLIVQKQYDAAGRLLTTKEKSGSSNQTTLSQNKYNELGQLAKKYIGLTRITTQLGSYTSTPLDSICYNYNIRGWLRGINKDYADIVSGVQGWFGEELCYDYGFKSPQLNGNISGTIWRNASDGNSYAYNYGYDAVNRLTRANFSQYQGSHLLIEPTNIDFSVYGIAYDNNGNILTFNQKGVTSLTASSTIDSLSYGYNANSNQLNYVTDAANNATSTLGDFKEPATANNTSQDYTYDGNGNLTQDNNKAISSIAYNYLNLPQTVTVTSKGTVTYTYDAGGNKLRKVTVDNTATPSITTKTDYIGAFVYQNDTLQYIAQEEGRIRPESNRPNRTDTMYYDYFEKDHLGDTRAVLTDWIQTDKYPACTMEQNNATSDDSYYSKVESTRFDTRTIPNFPTYTVYSNPNYYAAKTNGNANKIGPGIVLKVMSGDQVSIHVNDWYDKGTVDPSQTTPVSVLTDILSALEGSIPGVLTGEKGVVTNSLTNDFLTVPVDGFLDPRNSGANNNAPRAYLNYILFDDRMQVVMTGDGTNSGFQQVSATNKNYESINIALRKMTKSGYLYVYVSNETPGIDVLFDNLQVTQIRGPLLETDNYYPFGLAMAGINDNAASELQNNKLFNKGSELQHKEFSDGSGLELYSTEYRSLDPQLGRFWQIDPVAENNDQYSCYGFVENNPILLNDPTGLQSDSSNKPKPGFAPGTYNILKDVVVTSKKSGYKWWQFFNDHNPGGDFLYQLNKYNPLANAFNALTTYFTGHDTYGVPQDNKQATAQLLSIVPIGKVGMLAENVIGEGASSIFSQIGPKIAGQMAERGWTIELIHDAVNNPTATSAALNRATGNAATAFYTADGSYVVRDNITNEIIQISKKGDADWIPDASIVNPYKP